jgi:hypothetical protein
MNNPNLTKLSQLQHELDQAISDLIMTRSPLLLPSDSEDLTDRHQEVLEYNYWVDEQRDLIRSLEVEINCIRANLSSEELEHCDKCHEPNEPEHEYPQ